MLWNEGAAWLGVCVWNSLGAPPSAEQIEVTVLGPGHGESVVVHLGNGEWLIVDSCIDTSDPQKLAAPLKYLQTLGVQVEQAVKLIVVSHWDDDHFKGIADVVEACPNADFISSTAFSKEKFICYVEAISLGGANADGGNVDNIHRVLHLLNSRNKSLKISTPTRQLYNNPIVRCWSPSDFDSNMFLEYVARMHPKAGEGYRKALPLTPNLTSVVLTIEWPDSPVLLGADMEFSTNNQRGWGAVISETTMAKVPPGNLVKIPHHGSNTGHDDRMWTSLLQEKPISVIAPFGKGPVTGRPPKSSDIRRISAKSSKLYLTANHRTGTRPKMDLEVERCIREGLITLSNKKAPMGIVRHRRYPNDNWQCDIFGSAVCIK